MLKQIVCEMCGSNKMLKKDGIYECQYCGCQYTVEEARKLMVEGTVKIDDSDKVLNWIKLADSAYNNSSWKEAYSYYSKVLEVYPDEWRSTYRKALSIGWQSTLGNIHINETLGGITDAFKVLLASDNTDDFKAWGILSMDQDLLAWVSAVQSASVKHASEYTKNLESACYDYYERSVFMASAVQLAISLLNKFAVMNIEKISVADGVFKVIVNASDAICTSLSSKFRPLVGRKYSSFWQASIADVRDVSPTYAAKKAHSELSTATETMKREYPKWKHERLLRDDPDYDRKRLYIAALEKKEVDDIQSLNDAAKMFDNIADYIDSEELAAECRERIKEKKYVAGVEKKNADTQRALDEAIAQFEEISDYKDSAHLVEECKERIEELKFIGEQSRKHFRNRALVVIAIAAVIALSCKLISGRKTNIDTPKNVASLDMSTSLIKDGKIIPANKAYMLMINRIKKELGEDYKYQSNDDGSVQIYREGDPHSSYVIACFKESDESDFMPIDSKGIPEAIVVYDITADRQYADGVGNVISFLVDNEPPSAIQTILRKQLESFPDKEYPESFVLSLAHKGFHVSNQDWMEGFYQVTFEPTFYNYTEQSAKPVLYWLFDGKVSDDKILRLTDKQARYLLDYYADHELDYFADFDTLVKQSGMNDHPELSK